MDVAGLTAMAHSSNRVVRVVRVLGMKPKAKEVV